MIPGPWCFKADNKQPHLDGSTWVLSCWHSRHMWIMDRRVSDHHHQVDSCWPNAEQSSEASIRALQPYQDDRPVMLMLPTCATTDLCNSRIYGSIRSGLPPESSIMCIRHGQHTIEGVSGSERHYTHGWQACIRQQAKIQT